MPKRAELKSRRPAALLSLMRLLVGSGRELIQPDIRHRDVLQHVRGRGSPGALGMIPFGKTLCKRLALCDLLTEALG